MLRMTKGAEVVVGGIDLPATAVAPGHRRQGLHIHPAPGPPGQHRANCPGYYTVCWIQLQCLPPKKTVDKYSLMY